MIFILFGGTTTVRWSSKFCSVVSRFPPFVRGFVRWGEVFCWLREFCSERFEFFGLFGFSWKKRWFLVESQVSVESFLCSWVFFRSFAQFSPIDRWIDRRWRKSCSLHSVIRQVSWEKWEATVQAKTQPRSIPFGTKLFTPYFTYICDNSLPRFLKNHDFTFSPILLPRHKKWIHRTWLSQNPTKINSFCNQTFHTSFFMHLWKFPTKDCTKTIISLIRQFCYQGKKKPIHRAWLSQNPSKINSFCNQTFHTSFFMHLWQFPTKIGQKP